MTLLDRLFSERRSEGERRSQPDPVLLSRAVVVRIAGGIANQMLCYKLGRFVSQRFQRTLVFDATLYGSNRAPGERSFQLAHHPIVHDLLVFDRETMRLIRSSVPMTELTREVIAEAGGEGESRILDLIDASDVVSCDFWLALFLRATIDRHAEHSGVLDELELDTERCFTSRDNQCLQDIRTSENPVAVHVRRGDFATHDGGLLLGADYYRRATDAMERKVSSPTFFVFSDDIPWCREHLEAASPIHFIDFHTDDDASKALYLASKCRHFILSNESTFSHQIVQLNRNPSGRIVITSTWEDLLRQREAPSQSSSLNEV